MLSNCGVFVIDVTDLEGDYGIVSCTIISKYKTVLLYVLIDIGAIAIYFIDKYFTYQYSIRISLL
jgi:hypothetical protein